VRIPGGWQVSSESVAKWTDRSPLGFLQCWRWLVLPRVLDPSNSRFWQIISNRACGKQEPRRIRDHEEPTYLLEYCFTGSFYISARQVPGPVHHYVQLGRREETLLLCRYARRSASHPATQRLGMYRRLQLGSDGQGIWVDHGCRADFSVGGNTDYRDENRHDRDGSNRESQTFSCNSDDMRKHSCAVKTGGGTVRLVAQHSDAPCTKDYSWGTNRRGVWVNHGCRADFAVIVKYRRDSYR